MKSRGIFLAVLILAPAIGGADTRQTVSQIIEDQARRAAREWKLAPRIMYEEGASAEARSADQIILSRSALEKMTEGMDVPLRDAYTRFIVLHELWHARQFKEYASKAVQAPPDLKIVFECQADLMAGSAVALRLARQLPEGPEKIKALPGMGALLARLYAAVAAQADAEGGKFAHLTAYQRITAMRLGGLRGAIELANPVSKDHPDFLARAKRLINWRDGVDEAAWSLDMCKKITRYGAEVMRDVQENSPKGESDTSDPEGGVRHKFELSYRNNSNRPIRIAITALSGSHKPGDENNYIAHRYFDAASGEVTIEPGQVGRIQGELRFGAESKHAIFVRYWGFDPETLMYAEYAGPPRLVKNCNDGIDAIAEPDRRRTMATLMRIAGAAKDAFSDIPKKRSFEMAGHRNFDITMPLPGAVSGEVTLQANGAASAYITFYSGPDKAAAHKAYADLLATVVPACRAAGAPVKADSSVDEPSTRFSALTAYSAGFANVMIREPDAAKPAAEPQYMVGLHIDKNVTD